MVRATVRLVKTKNCFVNLPPHVARGLSGASEVISSFPNARKVCVILRLFLLLLSSLLTCVSPGIARRAVSAAAAAAAATTAVGVQDGVECTPLR